VLTLVGILVVIVGFALRLNALLVVTVAGLVTGLASGLGPVEVVSAFGKAFIESRYVGIVWMVLPVIGLLERAGLKERARTVIAGIPAATTGRVLMIYFAIRQVTAALGLTTLGGHAQMVRPLVAPMAEAAAEARHGTLPEPLRQRIRAMSAATDNVGLFFGEDVFVAFGAIVLMQTILKAEGLEVDPIHMALWGIPTAVTAFVIHAWNLRRLDARIRRETMP
jgi:uncharacterized membrane protein